MTRLRFALLLIAALLASVGGCDVMSEVDDAPPPKTAQRKDTPAKDTKPTTTPQKRPENANGPATHPGDVPKPAVADDVDPLADGDDDMTRALSHIASEVADARKLKQTLIVWLLDRSGDSSSVSRIVGSRASSVARASAVRVKKHGSQPAPLLTAVVAFGEKVEFLTPKPIDDPFRADSLAGGFSEEGTMSRTTFAAVNQAADKFLPYRRKGYEVLMVIVGNNFSRDWDQFEEAVPKLRRQEVTVFGIGQAVPFYRQWHADNRPNSVAKVPASLPLESQDIEGIDLGLPGGQADIDLTDSGYGPFGLERICRATLGRFYRLRTGNESTGWQRAANGDVEPELLRRFAPDYVGDRQYQDLLGANQACMSLHNASVLPHADPLGGVSLVFSKQKDEATLARMLTSAQHRAAEKSPDMDPIYNALAPGEADRPKLTSPRWQAEFDLAMGRILATKVRIDGYNAQLAVIKSGKAFANPKDSTTWVLKHSDGVKGNSALDKMAQKARMYLGRVAKDDVGTPWAQMAQRELSELIGWEWTEQ